MIYIVPYTSWFFMMMIFLDRLWYQLKYIWFFFLKHLLRVPSKRHGMGQAWGSRRKASWLSPLSKASAVTAKMALALPLWRTIDIYWDAPIHLMLMCFSGYYLATPIRINRFSGTERTWSIRTLKMWLLQVNLHLEMHKHMKLFFHHRFNCLFISL